MAKKAGVLLSGCGVFDGTEIHEAVLTLLALSRAGVKIICTAPDMEQLHVINHLTQTVTQEKRNVLIESARLARGEITDLKKITSADLDLLIIPGGFGAAKNLSDFAVKGPDATVHPEVIRIIKEMISSAKPIGAMCIAPATLVRALSGETLEVTIGNDADTATAIEKMGSKHMNCVVDSICVDKLNKIVTTPAYMLGPEIKDVAAGIEKLVEAVLALSDS